MLHGVAWVSVVSGEKVKDESEKGESWRRETPDTDAFTLAWVSGLPKGLG